jgi:dynein intermediate chain
VQTVGEEPYTTSVPEASAPQPPEPKPEVVTYSKAVQTDLSDPSAESQDGSVASDDEDAAGTKRSSKRLSRRERERDEEIRQKLRTEIEEELQATNQTGDDSTAVQSKQLRYPLRTLEEDELKAVTSSDDFLDFVERSAKVIERALDEEYDVLADYELGGVDGDLEEDEETGKKRRGIKEVCQFWDERWSKKRMVSDLSFSPKVSTSVISVLLRYQFCSSSLSSCWLHIPRTRLHPMNPMASSRSGINICTLDRNTCSTPRPIFSQLNSLLSIPT